MNNQKTPEEKLKDILEDAYGIPILNVRRAEMALRIYKEYAPQPTGGLELTYDECILLVKENNDILEHMPATDPAYQFMITQRNAMLKHATALNDYNALKRHDHEYPVHLMVSIVDVTVECTIHIPQLYYWAYERNKTIGSVLRNKIAGHTEWAGSYRNPPEIDFVEL